MTYRDLTNLSATEACRNFVHDFGLQLHRKEGQLYFQKDNCLLIHVYGFIVETIVYFDVYNLRDGTCCCDINAITSKYLDRRQIDTAYAKARHEHLIPVIDDAPGTLEAEQLFFVRLKMLREYLPALLSCNFQHYEDAFEPMNGMQQEKMKAFVS